MATANGPTPEKLLQRHMGEMLDRLQDITDSNLAVIQYKASFGIPPITLKDGTFADQFAAMSIGTFRRYFNRGALPRPGKEFWSDIFLAFNGDSRNFNRDSYQDLNNDFGVSLYEKGIQTSEYAERPYWFFYSHPDIDYNYLVKELLHHTGTELEIKLQKIPDGTAKP
eukprot:scaffold70166_cov59-Attheya_sp.AAC.11